MIINLHKQKTNDTNGLTESNTIKQENFDFYHASSNRKSGNSSKNNITDMLKYFDSTVSLFDSLQLLLSSIHGTIGEKTKLTLTKGMKWLSRIDKLDTSNSAHLASILDLNKGGFKNV